MYFGNILWTVAGKLDHDDHLQQSELESGELIKPKFMVHQINKRNTGKKIILYLKFLK